MRDIKQCEFDILKHLEWDLNSITPLHFTLNYIYQGVAFTDDMVHQRDDDESGLQGFGLSQPTGLFAVGQKAMSRLRRYIDYFSLQVLKQDFIMKRQYSLETVAMAVVWAARKAARFQTEWNVKGLQLLFGFNQEE